GGLSQGFGTLPAHKQGCEVVTVLTSAVRQFDTGCPGERSHQVRVRDGLIAHRTGLHLARPTYKEGYTVTALPHISLHPAPACLRAMTVLLDLLRPPVRAVVAGNDDEGVLGKPRAIEGIEYLADARIHLHGKITILTGLGASLKLP